MALESGADTEESARHLHTPGFDAENVEPPVLIRGSDLSAGKMIKHKQQDPTVCEMKRAASSREKSCLPRSLWRSVQTGEGPHR
jgi:hypothetical protein